MRDGLTAGHSARPRRDPTRTRPVCARCRTRASSLRWSRTPAHGRGIVGLVPGCSGIGRRTLLPTRQSHFRAVLEGAAFLGSVNGTCSRRGSRLGSNLERRSGAPGHVGRGVHERVLAEVCWSAGDRSSSCPGRRGRGPRLSWPEAAAAARRLRPWRASARGTSTDTTTSASSTSGPPGNATASFVAFGNCMTKTRNPGLGRSSTRRPRGQDHHRRRRWLQLARSRLVAVPGSAEGRVRSCCPAAARRR